MTKDIYGKNRQKVNLHLHTSLSDGSRSVEEAARIYRGAGYDAIAVTDHWKVYPTSEFEGMTLISGVEYNIGGTDCGTGVYHILGLGMDCAPASVTEKSGPQEIIDAIHSQRGLAVLAHPAWSLNTPEMIAALRGIDATEIYNTISGVHMSRREDSSIIIDMLASRGIAFPLLADDDTHAYDSDHCFAWIMAECDDNSQESILRAVRERKFYATQGPEVHLRREGDTFIAETSPCREIIFHSNLSWVPRVFAGDYIREAAYKVHAEEKFVRAEVVDVHGRRAWTNIEFV